MRGTAALFFLLFSVGCPARAQDLYWPRCTETDSNFKLGYNTWSFANDDKFTAYTVSDPRLKDKIIDALRKRIGDLLAPPFELRPLAEAGALWLAQLLFGYGPFNADTAYSSATAWEKKR